MRPSAATSLSAQERRRGDQGVAVQQMHRGVARADGVQGVDHRLAEFQAVRGRQDFDAEFGEPCGVGLGHGEGFRQHQVDGPRPGQGLHLQLVEPLGPDRQEGRRQRTELGGELLADQGAGHDQPDGHASLASSARISSWLSARNSLGRIALSSM
jgi:hypothetical protein